MQLNCIYLPSLSRPKIEVGDSKFGSIDKLVTLLHEDLCSFLTKH